MIGRMRRALLRHPVALVHLITHEVEEQDRDWFDRSRLHQVAAIPVRTFEVVRCVLLLLIAWPHDQALIAGVVVHAALLGCLATGIRAATARGDAPQALLGMWTRYLLVRAVAMAMINAALLLTVPPDRVLPIAMVLGIVGSLDFHGQFTVPVPAVLSGWIGAIGFAIAAALRPEINGPLVLLVGVIQAGWIHVQMFNLHYLFATRRLRTRELQQANQTIQLLLNQYDEHGSDWLVETDSRGRIVLPSTRLCRSTGISPAELEGRKLVDLLVHGPERDALRLAARTMKPFRDLPVSVVIDGALRHWSVSGCPIFSSQGHHSGFRAFMRDVTDRFEAESRVRYLAHHDALTQLANRAEFHARLEAHLARSVRGHAALMFIDLDHFKAINDSMGHAAGDHVLAESASRLMREVSQRDVVARLGGDEFAVLIARTASAEAALQRARAIIQALSAPITIDGRMVQVGASAGVALAPDHGDEGHCLLRAADLALYDAKARGRGEASLYHPDMQRELHERRSLEVELRTALAAGQFVVHYQPLHRLDTDEIAGCEALLRWNHPTRGMIEPGKFIPVAEESGLILQIGEWVLREALAEAATWPEHLTIAVNVSASQLRDGELLRQAVSALSASGVDPRRLELEITETMLMEDSETHLRLLHRLRALGVRIALDDFGTGYSSLNYLRAFPFDKIKIDRCFVTDLARNDESGAIVEAVLDLAARLNMQTIAEGVEDAEQLARLRESGCHQVQGYLFSRALPAGQLPIERHSAKAHVIMPVLPLTEAGRRGLRPCPTSTLLTQGTAALKLDCSDCAGC